MLQLNQIAIKFSKEEVPHLNWALECQNTRNIYEILLSRKEPTRCKKTKPQTAYVCLFHVLNFTVIGQCYTTDLPESNQCADSFLICTILWRIQILSGVGGVVLLALLVFFLLSFQLFFLSKIRGAWAPPLNPPLIHASHIRSASSDNHVFSKINLSITQSSASLSCLSHITQWYSSSSRVTNKPFAALFALT